MHLKRRESWILYEDSFSCVCVLIEPASCTYFFLSFIILRSLSCDLCSAQRTTAAGLFWFPCIIIRRRRVHGFVNGHPSHTQVSQLLFFTSWFRHLLSIQLNKIFSSPWKLKKEKNRQLIIWVLLISCKWKFRISSHGETTWAHASFPPPYDVTG